jgi:hypothetical protein
MKPLRFTTVSRHWASSSPRWTPVHILTAFCLQLFSVRSGVSDATKPFQRSFWIHLSNVWQSTLKSLLASAQITCIIFSMCRLFITYLVVLKKQLPSSQQYMKHKNFNRSAFHWGCPLSSLGTITLQCGQTTGCADIEQTCTDWSPQIINWRFVGIYRFHLRPSRLRQQISPKRRFLLNGMQYSSNCKGLSDVSFRGFADMPL